MTVCDEYVFAENSHEYKIRGLRNVWAWSQVAMKWATVLGYQLIGLRQRELVNAKTIWSERICCLLRGWEEPYIDVLLNITLFLKSWSYYYHNYIMKDDWEFILYTANILC